MIITEDGEVIERIAAYNRDEHLNHLLLNRLNIAVFLSQTGQAGLNAIIKAKRETGQTG